MGRCSCGAGYQPARIPQHGGRGYKRGTVGGLQTARRDAGGTRNNCFTWNTFPILFLPGAVREFFGNDRLAEAHHLLRQPAMQALAMGRQFPFLARQPLSGCLVPLAGVPGQVCKRC